MTVAQLRALLLEFTDDLPVRVYVGIDLRDIEAADVDDPDGEKVVVLETTWPETDK